MLGKDKNIKFEKNEKKINEKWKKTKMEKMRK